MNPDPRERWFAETVLEFDTGGNVLREWGGKGTFPVDAADSLQADESDSLHQLPVHTGLAALQILFLGIFPPSVKNRRKG